MTFDLETQASFANEYAGYHRFEDTCSACNGRGDNCPHCNIYGFVQFGSFEVFWSDSGEFDADGEALEAGWYWHACQPGCLPDGDASGPFPTSQDAWESAQDI